MHRDASYQIDERSRWSRPSCSPPARWRGSRPCATARSTACATARPSVLAPTGTIGLMMDCDTTGIEPDLGLVKMKKLVGGGTMSIVNQTIPRALRRLGYDAQQVDEIIAYIDVNKSILGAPHLAPEHVPVFACSMGDNTIHYEGHVRMMGAVQPFLSGAISQDGQHARGGDGRGGRGAAPAVVGARPEGRRHLPRQLQGRPAAVDRQEGRRRATPRRRGRSHAGRREDRREDRPQAAPPEAAPHPLGQDVRVPGRRLQGLRHGRRVRRRPARRDLPHRVASRARRWRGSWTPSPSRSATACSTACRCGRTSRRS